MDIGRHIQAIVDTLGTETERIPLRRAVRSCLTDFDALRGRGLTWTQIAARLTQAGARDKAGRPIAAHNLRTEYARLAAEQGGHEVRGGVVRHASAGVKLELSYKPIIKSPSVTVPTPSPASRSTRLAEILKTRPRPLDLDDQ